MSGIFDQIRSMFAAAIPVVALSSPSPEELTVLEKIYYEVAQKLPQPLPVFVWDLGHGLRTIVPTANRTGIQRLEPSGYEFGPDPLNEVLDLIMGGGETEGDETSPFSNGVFVLCDIAQFTCGDRAIPEVIRRIKNLAFALKRAPRKLILLDQDLILPSSFQGLVYELHSPLPGIMEVTEAVNLCIEGMVRRFKQKSADTGEDHDLKIDLPSDQKDRLIRSCLGLSIEEILNALRLSIIDRRCIDSETSEMLTRFKVKKLALLNVEFYEKAEVMPGGCKAFQEYAKQRTSLFARSLQPQTGKLKHPTPKGVLLVGPSGTGKTLLARTVQHLWGIPALKVDISKFYGGVVGETEANLRQFIAIAESIAPCVVVLDEIEKALSGATAGNGDSGVSRRMIGSLLQWMNDKTAPVYIMATANDVSELQAQYPELFRKGRFDDIFYVGLPNTTERAEIFANHLENQQCHLPAKDLAALAAATESYTGAEIAKIVSDAVLTALTSDRDLLILSDIQTAIADNQPQAKNNAGRIQALTEWVNENGVRHASAPDEQKKNASQRKTKAQTEKADLDVMI